MKKNIIKKLKITKLLILILICYSNLYSITAFELTNNYILNSNISNSQNPNSQYFDFSNSDFIYSNTENLFLTNQNQDLSLFNNNTHIFNEIFSEEFDNADFVNSDFDNSDFKESNSDTLIEFKRITIEEFKYADVPKFTITGNLPYEETHFSYLNTGLVVGGVTTLFILQHIAQAETIWKDKSKFRIQEDGSYALYADKPGHIFGTYLASYAMTEALMTSGVDWESSVVTGGILGFAYNTYVEVLDGYGANFGFSPSDMYANAFGAGFFIGQYYSPFLQNITPKFTYFPANWHGERKRQPHDFFIDDYSSHTLWFSFNIHNLLPENYQDYWPTWLELSVGYAARNLTVAYDPDNIYYHDPNVTYKNNDVEGDPKFIIALDYNLVKLLPDGGSFWNWAKQTLNFFKLPSPAIEIGINGQTRFFLLYPFPIN